MRDIVLKYKAISTSMIECLENDSIEKLDELLKQREICIEEIKKSDNEKEKISILLKENGIFELDNKIKNMIIEAKNSVRDEIDNLNREKNANDLYGRQFQNIYFINKQI